MKNSLKVAITCYPSVGGSGVLASQLGEQLARRGLHVHFVSYARPFRLDTSSPNIFFHPVDVNEYELFKHPDYTLPLSVKLAEVSRSFELDLLHVHYAVPHATAAFLARQMLGSDRPRIITTLHGTDTTLMGQDPGYQPIIKHAIENSSGVTAVSEFLRRETVSTFGIDRDIRVIHNFFEPRVPNRSRPEVRAELGIGDEFLVIHLSNLRTAKRIDDLLKIIAASRNRKRLRLLILAGGNFAPYRPLLSELGLEKTVVIKESVLDIENYLNASDLGLYTSEHESFGLSILESMFHRHPVLATDAGGVPEVVEQGRTGFIFPVGDIKGFVAKLDAIVESPEEYRGMGARGYQRAQSLFSAEAIVSRYLSFYEEVLAG